jgi:glycosyltransferase involved in cell wall biosynthesis
MKAEARVAFFTDSFLEVNGVAHTSRQLAAFAQRRGIPFLAVHAAPETRKLEQGSLVRLGLERSRAGFALDADLRFDLLMWRHARLAIETVREFRAEAVHVTGPSDIGLLGLYVARRLGLPLVMSWHTNVHEYAGRRLGRITPFLPAPAREAIACFAERRALRAATMLYKQGRALLAPNEELGELLARACDRPVFMMRRGVDTELFSPRKRLRSDGVFTLGYVGRLTPEKNVRMLAAIERELLAAGFRDFRFVIAGAGSERAWLEQNLECAEFTGVLKGESLARVYANFDLFIFPSATDTFGNVVLEAMASGAPPIVMPHGGPRFIIRHGESGLVAGDAREFAAAVLALQSDPERRARMREAARRQAREASWDAVFEQVFAAYAAGLRQPLAAPEFARKTTTNPAVVAANAGS